MKKEWNNPELSNLAINQTNDDGDLGCALTGSGEVEVQPQEKFIIPHYGCLNYCFEDGKCKVDKCIIWPHPSIREKNRCKGHGTVSPS